MYKVVLLRHGESTWNRDFLPVASQGKARD